MSSHVAGDSFPITIIDTGLLELPEQLGTKQKYWLRLETKRNLYKIGRPETGENWAEVIASRLADRLRIPHAYYEFAVCGDEQGVLSPSIVPEDGRLILGNELLAKINPTYPAHRLRQVSDHTLSRIHGLLTRPDIEIPPGWVAPHPSIMTAFDLFLGYLLFDVWIANQDRHHENWGVIQHCGRIYLAPSFDHAASMGQNETDKTRQERLVTRDAGRHICAYVTRARSAIYEHQASTKPLPTLDLFQKAATKSPAAAADWIRQIEAVSNDQVAQIFSRLPNSQATPTAKAFAMRLLQLNRQRLITSLTS